MEQIRKFLRDKGFALALLACLVAAAAAGVWAVRTVRDELDKNLSGLKTPDSTSTAPGIDEGLSTTTPQEDETTWEWPTEPAANSVSNVPKAASSASRSASSASSAPQAGSGSVREPSALQGASSPASSSAAPASTQPVSGRVLNGYSGDELVYSKTLGDWRTHNGVDYAAEKGAEVAAPAAGKVVETGTDDKWGPVVAIEDDSGRVWRICGTADAKVKKGDTVSAGQTIGKVGSVSCECAEESHIHLEVMQDGRYLDPVKAMK
jgi:murein DD-endopeptidase MepM/ murein hydrolase activator NlpD